MHLLLISLFSIFTACNLNAADPANQPAGATRSRERSSSVLKVQSSDIQKHFKDINEQNKTMTRKRSCAHIEKIADEETLVNPADSVKAAEGVHIALFTKINQLLRDHAKAGLPTHNQYPLDIREPSPNCFTGFVKYEPEVNGRRVVRTTKIILSGYAKGTINFIIMQP